MDEGIFGSMQPATLTIDRLCKRFGAAEVVANVTLNLGKGQVVSLLGPSGCGKTTTLRCIAGFYHPDSGTITVSGRVVAGSGVSVPPEERGLSMVFQNYVLWPHMTAFDNIAYGLRVQGVRHAEVQARVADLTLVLGLQGLERRYPHELSGGQQQRVAVARSLAVDPAVLLLDEPFSNLDAKLRGEMRYEMRELLKRLGTTALYVTHDQEEAMVLSDRILLMDGGRIVEQGTPADLYERPSRVFTAQFFGFTTFIPGLVRRRNNRLILASESLGVDVPLPDTCEAVPGDRKVIALRPNGIEIGTPDGQLGWITAQVMSSAYVGGAFDVHLGVREFELRARVPAPRWRAESENVDFRFHTADMVVLPDETTTSPQP